jgi:tetratricopeptide (TPR) repeat protein
MNMKAVTAGLLVFSFAHTALSCIWITGTKFSGESVRASGLSGAKLLRINLRTNRKPDGAQMEASLRGATNFNDRSDYSVALMYLGRSDEAVELLQSLEKERPGNYFIAANLGTALELSGNNEEALHWIQEGIRRDPKSHEGTEWLHANILEAKIAAKKDPDYFKKHSVLELQPQTLGEQVAIGPQKISRKKLAEAIQYQLSERMQLVKPPDPSVASLLFDYAAIEAVTKTLESAKSILQMAVEYGYPSDKVQPLVTLYDRRIAWRKTKQRGFYCLVGMGFIGLLYFLYKRRIFVLSRQDLPRQL